MIFVRERTKIWRLRFGFLSFRTLTSLVKFLFKVWLTQSKKVNYILHRKNLNIVIFEQEEMLKSSFFRKQKFSKRSLGISHILTLLILFLLHNNLIRKVWVALINERQHKARGFFGKISESHGINPSRAQWVLPENYNDLSPVELLDLCCSVVQFIPLVCGSIAVA